MSKRAVQMLTLLGVLTLGAARAAEPLTVADYGDDGGGRYYQVTCSDGTEGSVVEKAQPVKEICAMPTDRDELCRPSWTVKQAAAYVCR